MAGTQGQGIGAFQDYITQAGAYDTAARDALTAAGGYYRTTSLSTNLCHLTNKMLLMQLLVRVRHTSSKRNEQALVN